jgi:acyl carrier protein
MTRDEIFEKMQSLIVDTLAVDDDEVTMESRLISDLGAESIDFLHIDFELQKAFGFKTQPGELFPDNVARDPEFVQQGFVTAKGVAMLREKLPHANFASLGENPPVSKVAELFTVGALVSFVERKLAAR